MTDSMMDLAAIQPALNSLIAADVVKAYSGRRGCACGCRGKYHTRRSTVSQILNRMKAAVAAGDAVNYVTDADFIGIDTATRSYTVYFRADD